jgi:hypothetical protein
VPGVVSVPITFVPTAEGDFTASYAVATDLPSQPIVQFDVVAHGGAPDVFLPVTQLVLGPDAGLLPGFDVQNVGTLPSTPDSRVSLQFGSPPWEVRAEPGVRPEELCVDTNAFSPGPCELPAQLPKLARGETLHLFVRATPSSAGPRRFQVMLHVNDPDEPTPTVDVLVP